MKIPGRGWAYLGALLGGAVSIAANIAHSYVPPEKVAKTIEAAHRIGVKTPEWTPQPGAVVGAIFWPVALFVVIEILARVPWPEGTRWWWIRFGGLIPVAVVAAVVSYRHLSGLLDFYGEDGLTVVIGPLAVDGLMVMATGALIATSRARAAAASDTAPTETDAPATPPAAVEPDGQTFSERTAQQPAVSSEQTVPPAVSTPPARLPARRQTAADRVAKAAARTPAATPAQLAARLKLSERTVQRYLPRSADDTTPPAEQPLEPVNGHAVPDLVTTSSTDSEEQS